MYYVCLCYYEVFEENKVDGDNCCKDGEEGGGRSTIALIIVDYSSCKTLPYFDSLGHPVGS